MDMFIKERSDFFRYDLVRHNGFWVIDRIISITEREYVVSW